jgi:hypothetical protein
VNRELSPRQKSKEAKRKATKEPEIMEGKHLEIKVESLKAVNGLTIEELLYSPGDASMAFDFSPTDISLGPMSNGSMVATGITPVGEYSIEGGKQ